MINLLTISFSKDSFPTHIYIYNFYLTRYLSQQYQRKRFLLYGKYLRAKAVQTHAVIIWYNTSFSIIESRWVVLNSIWFFSLHCRWNQYILSSQFQATDTDNCLNLISGRNMRWSFWNYILRCPFIRKYYLINEVD